MKKLLITTLLILPFSAFAALPTFPMSFYGAAMINSTPAPVGTIVRAYYGAMLVGQVTVNEVGVYGYDNPTKQQLFVGEGTGTIRFTVQSSIINSGAETEGATLQSHPSFESGGILSKNLIFTWSPPVVPVPIPAPSNGGGGGGGGAPVAMYGCMDKKAVNYSSLANTDNKACIYPTGVASTTIVAIQITQPKVVGEVLGATIFIFTRNLSIGSKGIDVTELQKRLTTLGYYSGPMNGYFGPLTSAGVRKYQLSKVLEATGSVGPKTRAALNQTGSVLGASTTTPSTLSDEARVTLISKLLAQILELQKQIVAMKAGR